MNTTRTLLVLAFIMIAVPATAQQPIRRGGPVIRSAGEVFVVADPDFATPLDMPLRVAFETADAASAADAINPGLNTVARFLNMHAQAGVPLRNLQVAVVVHGPAGRDLLDDAAYRKRHGVPNPNSALLGELTGAGVRIILCGQTAASRGLDRRELAPGVQLALSAMTAFAVLQAQNYYVNPF